MTRRLLFLILALMMFAAPSALAVNTTHWPMTLVDNTCTDTEDTPAPGVGSVQPAIQISGTADGFCDHDSRILTGAITSDTQFTIPMKSVPCVYFFATGVTVTGGDTKWGLNQLLLNPITGGFEDADIGLLRTAAQGNFVAFGNPTGWTSASLTELMRLPVTNPFILELDLNTATSWEGNISMVRCK